MTQALIGHTGFVGGQLARDHPFEDFYNSKNVEKIAGRSFDLIVCSGAPAEKWKANCDPDADLANLDTLWNALRQAKAEKMILISTIDVFAVPIQGNEDDVVDPSRSTAYGRHRFELERRVADHFDTLIVRLPGLFGPGLKKNAIFDLLHDHEIHKIDHRAFYQFYDITRLWADLKIAQAHQLRLLHLATEPISMFEVARAGFGVELVREPLDQPPRYDFRTKHAQLFGGHSGYLMSQHQVLQALRDFVHQERSLQRPCA